MARYGREYMGGLRRGGRRRMHQPAYGEEYGRVYGYGAEPYDYEFGGRGWPYQESYSRRRYRAGRRGRIFGGRYEQEMRRPEAYGADYGYEYEYGRAGAPGYRRGGMGMRGRDMERQGRMFRGRTMPADLGYEGEFAGRPYGGRMIERGYERRAGMGAADYDIELTSRAGMLSGHTPPDRWPDIGHDTDMRPSRERRMSDDEIRETVLENLFQDTWVDPENIDVEVNQGVVTLTGDVRDFMEARYAWDDAWESAGVRGVINNLTVRTDRPQEEMELPQTAGARKSR